MDTRRSFLKKAGLISGGASLINMLPPAIQKALAINPAAGSTFMDAEHIVLLMQENRSFDHTYGTLQGVRGFNDPRAITLPDKNLVWLQTNDAGETYAPFRFDIKGTNVTWMSSLPHGWADQVDARNHGKYDKWLQAKRSGHKEYADMPLTMGYYSRADIPFYYSLADAFTVCDQNFCSSLTGTTPNRLYFWTGTIREQPTEKAQANVWNDDADHDTMVSWESFPERLEDLGIPWKVYQNEISIGVGLTDEEDGWLANFTDNPLEFFKQYNVKLSAAYIANLPKQADKLSASIKKLEEQLATLNASSTEAEKLKKDLATLQKQLANNTEDQKKYTREKYEQLSPREKNIHNKAFSTNISDPNYHQLTDLKYKDGDIQRELKIPKGDILHEFRKDVEKKELPAVSWLVAPANFSDHPGSAWFGAWYISEVMDILTKNPEVWKKTIFILTYDENDGYFDHVPPFVPPHPQKKGSGAVSKNIDSAVEYVVGPNQQNPKRKQRESSIGLGYRVPMVIASPWTRGGWVNSEVFDHTSSIQFLEKFLTKKYNKKIQEPNISEWRRTVCGDLTSVFRPYKGEKIELPPFLKKDEFVESIHKAKFKNPPNNFKKLNAEEIAKINREKQGSGLIPVQEKGIRSSCALPYELYADGNSFGDGTTFEIIFKAGKELFGDAAAGSAFHVYAPGIFLDEPVETWTYTTAAGTVLTDKWQVGNFENNEYHLRVYGPNGFFREFKGNQNDKRLRVYAGYQKKGKGFTGNIQLNFNNVENQDIEVEITDNSYGSEAKAIAINRQSQKDIVLDQSKSYGWYDFSVKIKGNNVFEKRFAGRVETGDDSKSDPLMGNFI